MANQKLIELSSRIVKNEATDSDKRDFLQVIDALRQKGATNPQVNYEINEIITRTADAIFQPKTNFYDLIADTERVEHGQAIKFKIPKRTKVAMHWSARGASVDYERVGNQEVIIAKPEVLSAGYYYDIDQLLSGNIDGFVGVVDKIVEGMTEKINTRIITVLSNLISSAPDNNKWVGAGITLQDFNKVTSTIQRYDRNTSVICDIDFAKNLNGLINNNLLSDKMKDELNEKGILTIINGTKVVPFTNTFTDETNTELVVPREFAFVVPTGSDSKVIKVGFEGGLVQYTAQDINRERALLKVTQKVSVDVVTDVSRVGFLQDTNLA